MTIDETLPDRPRRAPDEAPPSDWADPPHDYRRRTDWMRDRRASPWAIALICGAGVLALGLVLLAIKVGWLP